MWRERDRSDTAFFLFFCIHLERGLLPQTNTPEKNSEWTEVMDMCVCGEGGVGVGVGVVGEAALPVIVGNTSFSTSVKNLTRVLHNTGNAVK